MKQNLFELKEEEESSAEEEFEQYEIDYGLGQWQPS